MQQEGEMVSNGLKRYVEIVGYCNELKELFELGVNYGRILEHNASSTQLENPPTYYYRYHWQSLIKDGLPLLGHDLTSIYRET